MNYFTSDLHLGATDVNRLYTRGFNTTIDHDRFIATTINKVCKENDILYIIGDAFDCGLEGQANLAQAISILEKTNCEKYLILGNNEMRILRLIFNGDLEAWWKTQLSDIFEKLFVSSTMVKISGRPVNLVHNPEFVSYKDLNLYGHVHFDGVLSYYGINVCCNLHGYKPISEEYVKMLCQMGAEYKMYKHSRDDLRVLNETYANYAEFWRS